MYIEYNKNIILFFKNIILVIATKYILLMITNGLLREQLLNIRSVLL